MANTSNSCVDAQSTTCAESMVLRSAAPITRPDTQSPTTRSMAATSPADTGAAVAAVAAGGSSASSPHDVRSSAAATEQTMGPDRMDRP